MNRLLAATLAVAALVFATALPRAASRTLPAAGKTALDSFLGEQVSRGAIPGVVVHVVSRDGR